MNLVTYWKNLSVKKKLVIVLLSVPIVLSLTQLINTAKHVVEGQNKPNQVLAERVADNVLDKIDRNFYERFGDVQAFAFNVLARKGALKSSEKEVKIEKKDKKKKQKKESKEKQDTTAKVDYSDVQNFMNTMVSYYALYDVMMICDRKGDVQFINTKEKSGKNIYSSFIVGKNISNEPWFHACMNPSGPEGGAWYSDFMESDIVKEIYHTNGYGMGFAAPIKNAKGDIIGVWYNFANWKEVTQTIREEAQGHLSELSKDAKLIITDAQNKVIDGEDESLIEKKYIIDETEINTGKSIFKIDGENATSDNALVTWDKSEGAFSYKGKGWKAMVIVPKARLTFGTFFSEDLIGIIVIILVMMAIAILFSLLFSVSLTKRIDKTNAVLQKLGKGELVKLDDVEHTNDEIGQIIQSVDELSENLSKTANFSKNIGEGDLEAEFEPLGSEDVLGNSLITMRANLKQVKEEEAKRNWVVEGLAKFTIFTRDTSDEEKFYNVILSNLIRYIHANQGYLYVINDEDPENVHMEVKAVYAYGKQRYLEEKQVIKYKQGMVGQAWFDKEPLYFTEIPTDYVNITSGMGESTPTCIFIVPLKVNDEVYGALEIASFEELTSEKVEFINKLSETIASTISTVKMNERTKLLLMQSQQQAENLRSQEEEIRQNMEEMQATSAEMQRVQRQMTLEKQKMEEEFLAQSQIINSIAIVSKTDVQGNITYVNDEFCKWAKYSREEVMGKNHRILRHPDMPAEAFDDLWQTISSGRIWRGEVKNLAKDGSYYWVDAIIAPVLDKSGKPKEYIAQRFVINEKKEQEAKLKELLNK